MIEQHGGIPETETQAAFARRMGLTRGAITAAVKSGRLTLTPDGRVDPIRGVREMIENTDPAKSRAGRAKLGRFTDAREVREKY